MNRQGENMNSSKDWRTTQASLSKYPHIIHVFYDFVCVCVCVSCIDTAMVHRQLQQLPPTLLSRDNCFQQEDTGSALSRLHLWLKGIT